MEEHPPGKGAAAVTDQSASYPGDARPADALWHPPPWPWSGALQQRRRQLAAALPVWALVTLALTRAACRAVVDATARPMDTLAAALTTGGQAALRTLSVLTELLAAGLPPVVRAAQATVGRLADGVYAAACGLGRGALLAVAWLQWHLAGGLLAFVDRVTPVGARLGSLGALTVALLMTLSAAMVPAVGAYRDAVSAQLLRPDAAVLAPLAERSVVYGADGSVLAVLHDEVNRRIVPLEAVPEHVRLAVITAEDRSFFRHDGYDLKAISRAAVANVRGARIEQGGSTITQQIAKNNFAGSEATLQRKARELGYAQVLEEAYTKEQLLERYLNEVYFGAGAYGIAAAAEEFFGKDPADLTVAEAATLAQMIPSPALFDPRRHPDRALGRRNTVLAGMRQEGYLNAADYAAARAEALDVRPLTPPEVREPFVVEAVKRSILRDPRYGETAADRYALLFSGGLRIHTTIDPALHEAARTHITNALGTEGGPTAAIAAVDPRNGRIVAMTSGRQFQADQYDLATQGRRQPGSSMKTFVYAAALEHGWQPDEPIDASSPLTLDFGGLEPWEVQNYNGASYGTISLHEALVRSSNTAFAQLILGVGQPAVEDVLDRLGIYVDGALGVERGGNPAMALGGVTHGMTPLEMAAAYGTFATAGSWARPYLIQRVETATGDIIHQAEPEIRAVMDPGVALAVRDTLEAVVTSGTGRRAQVPDWPVAGKTGTTQSFADAWFAGTTPVLATAVWVGHPDARLPMANMTGGTVPAQLWQAFTASALEGMQPEPFHGG
jgi:membrane peptidoglycan carboxypeptidase